MNIQLPSGNLLHSYYKITILIGKVHYFNGHFPEQTATNYRRLPALLGRPGESHPAPRLFREENSTLKEVSIDVDEGDV